MKAEALFHQRIDYDDGAIVEMVIWSVKPPVPPSTHGLKYSLFYGRPGLREVGYDNERGRGGAIDIFRVSRRPIGSALSNG